MKRAQYYRFSSCVTALFPLLVATEAGSSSSRAGELRFAEAPSEVRTQCARLSEEQDAYWHHWNPAWIRYHVSQFNSGTFLRLAFHVAESSKSQVLDVRRDLECEIAFHGSNRRVAIRGPGLAGAKSLPFLESVSVSDGIVQTEMRGDTNSDGRPIYTIGTPNNVTLPAVIQGMFMAGQITKMFLDAPGNTAKLKDLVLVSGDDGELMRIEIVAQNGARDVYHLSPMHDGLGIGEEHFDENGTLASEIVDVEFGRFGDRWFTVAGVKRWYHVTTSELLREERLSHVHVETDATKFPEGLFHLEIPPNAAVLNTDTGLWRRDPEAVAQEIRRVTRQTPLRVWLIVVNVFALAALCVYVYRRTRKA